jgi:hypothetical protein
MDCVSNRDHDGIELSRNCFQRSDLLSRRFNNEPITCKNVRPHESFFANHKELRHRPTVGHLPFPAGLLRQRGPWDSQAVREK